MDEKPVIVKEGFTPVQGCLLAAVILFVLLLGISIVLAYRQFRENTGTPSTPAGAFVPVPVPVPVPGPVAVAVPASSAADPIPLPV